MANTINLTSKLQSQITGDSVSNATQSFSGITVAGSKNINTIQSIAGNAWTAVSTGAVTLSSQYWLWIRNLSATYTVKVALDNAGTNQFAEIPVVGSGEVCGPIPVKASKTVYLENSSSAATTSDVEIVCSDS